jgi:hypothetical protein
VEHLESDDGSTLSAILLPPGFRVREGAELWGGARIGRLLGAGMQVGACWQQRRAQQLRLPVVLRLTLLTPLLGEPGKVARGGLLLTFPALPPIHTHRAPPPPPPPR